MLPPLVHHCCRRYRNVSPGLAIRGSKNPGFGTVFPVLTALGHGGLSCPTVVPLQSSFSISSRTPCTIYFLIPSPRLILLLHSAFVACATQQVCFFEYSSSLSGKLPLALLRTTATELDKTCDTSQVVLNELVCFVNIRATAELNSLLV